VLLLVRGRRRDVIRETGPFRPKRGERGRNGGGCAALVGLPVALGRLLEGLASREEGIQGGAGPVDVVHAQPLSVNSYR
jgi:hypothetical protein